MPSISPVITINSTPGIEVTTSAPGIDYASLISGLGVAVFKVITLYYRSAILAQLSNPIRYSVYDANGNLAGQTIVTPVSGQQFQAAEFVQLKSKGIIINGQSGLNFNMLAGNQIQFIFFSIEKQNQDVLDRAGLINNFKTLESEMGIPDFFGSTDYIDPHTEEVFPEI